MKAKDALREAVIQTLGVFMILGLVIGLPLAALGAMALVLNLATAGRWPEAIAIAGGAFFVGSVIVIFFENWEG